MKTFCSDGGGFDFFMASDEYFNILIGRVIRGFAATDYNLQNSEACSYVPVRNSYAVVVLHAFVQKLDATVG
jgi:hypothetical protein